uniref:Uncharacterized protein n=1 Tax=Pseudoalteromonas rubra TaxID=43658 RepID=A0A0F4QED9_9GAMM|nr:hypothetical protein TW77_22130 [Pseudoalteromonas rubra]
MHHLSQLQSAHSADSYINGAGTSKYTNKKQSKILPCFLLLAVQVQQKGLHNLMCREEDATYLISFPAQKKTTFNRQKTWLKCILTLLFV